jgi:hypothetical protein
MMRSGTHILIDLLLNNFAVLKKSPLYVNLDMFVHSGQRIAPLDDARGAVIKTHFPQTIECRGNEEVMQDFLKRNKVILVVRDQDQIRKSLQNFGAWGKAEVNNFEQSSALFKRYWDETHTGNVMRLQYADLIQPQKLPQLLEQIEAFTGLTKNSRTVGVIPKEYRWSIFIGKILTRLLGRRAPRIYTVSVVPTTI